MNTIDEIIRKGSYRDRRNRLWSKGRYSDHWSAPIGFDVLGTRYVGLMPDQMRLLIERDQHREVCPRLRDCGDHPTVYVAYFRNLGWTACSEPERDIADWYNTHAEAMDAARALAVGS